jgi:quinol monooxygenase YgiN
MSRFIVLKNYICSFAISLSASSGLQDDNVTFLFAGVWKSYADLKDHLESETTLDFLKDLAEKRVVFTTTQVIEVVKGGDRDD